ncbi:MAG: hypothetical protein ACLFRR_10645 [Spirochaetaceae bacterium]
MLELTPAYRAAYAGCSVGYLSLAFETPPTFTDALEAELERRSRETGARYGTSGRGELKRLPVISDYVRHFRRFKKSYHVLLQLASTAEGKALPRISPLVSIMLAAEVSTFVLCSGHNLDAVSPPLTFDVASAERTIDLLDGRTQALKDGDIHLRDGDTVLAAVVYGQSVCGMMTEQTTRILYVAYGVPGVEEAKIRAALDDLAALAGLAGGGSTVVGSEVIAVS